MLFSCVYEYPCVLALLSSVFDRETGRGVKINCLVLITALHTRVASIFVSFYIMEFVDSVNETRLLIYYSVSNYQRFCILSGYSIWWLY